MVEKITRYAMPDIRSDDRAAVLAALGQDFLTQGPTVEVYEKSIGEKVQCDYVFAFNSATSALHAAYLSLGVKKNDCVWTSPITFVATANAALMCGAKVDFVDIEESTFNLSMDALAQKLEKAEINDTLPKVVTVVHLAGEPAEMSKLKKMSIRYGFLILEDASHALGSSINEVPIGSCEFSDMCVFSTHAIKVISTGEGGLATTQSKVYADRLEIFRSHGVVKDTNRFSTRCMKDEPWGYDQIGLGYNYRLNDIQASLGISQLQKLELFIETREFIRSKYSSRLFGTDIKFQKQQNNTKSANHLMIIKLNDQAERYKLFTHLKNHRVEVGVHYIPVHYHSFYKNMGFDSNDFPVANDYYARCLSLPMHTKLTEEEVNHTCDLILSSLKSA